MLFSSRVLMDITKEMDLNWGHGVALLTGAIVLLVPKARRGGKEKTHWPEAPGKLPMLGHALSLADQDEFYNTLLEWGSTVGQKEGIYEFSLMGKRWIVLCSSETVMAAMKLRPYKLIRTRMLATALDSLKGFGLFTSEGERWRQERRIVAPALNQHNVRDFYPNVQMISQRLVEKWSASVGSVIPAANVDVASSISDIIALSIFGMDLDTFHHPDSQLATDIHSFAKIGYVRTLSPIPYWKIPLIGPYLDGYRQGNQRLLDTLTYLVQQYKKRKANGEARDGLNKNKPFMEKIIDNAESEKAKLSDEQVVGNLMTMLTAGTDTTSNSINFALWELANDAVLQEEIYQEIQEYMQANKRTPDGLAMEDALECFPRLRSFLFEVLRLKPTAPLNFLEPFETMQFEGKTIEPGDVLIALAPSYPLDKHAKSEVPLGPNGESPREFCPHRWLGTENVSEEEKKDESSTKVKLIIPTQAQGGFMSFGYGLRICPGKKLAEVEMATLLIHILNKFQISPAENHPPLRMVLQLTATLNGPMNLSLKARTE